MLSFYYTIDATDNDSSGSDGHVSTGIIIGIVFGGFIILVFMIFIILCCLYIKYSHIKMNQNHNYSVTQQQTQETFAVQSGSPPPPAYTPFEVDAGYIPVPPRGYQPTVSTNVPYPPVNEDSTQ